MSFRSALVVRKSLNLIKEPKDRVASDFAWVFTDQGCGADPGDSCPGAGNPTEGKGTRLDSEAAGRSRKVRSNTVNSRNSVKIGGIHFSSLLRGFFAISRVFI